MLKLAAAAVIAAFGLAGCNESRPQVSRGADPSEMTVAFSWCSNGSPSFKIGNIPAATTSLRFKMVDRDVPGWNHGGGEVPIRGPVAMVPCGAFAGGYNGPVPPVGQIHTYEWTVTAYDHSGAVLALGAASKTFHR